MKKYLIVTPGYNSFCGGIKVLHRLCHLLNEQGIPAYLTAEGTPKDWNVKFLKDLSPEEIADMQQTGVVVYPDVVWGNPCRFNNCVQYDLQAMRPIQSNMLGVSLEDCFESKVKADLTMLVIYMEYFFTLPEKEERRGICYYKGKGKKVCPNSDWINIAGVGREDLAKLYQTSGLLVCADNMTQTTVEARLCGCPVKMNEPSMMNWEHYRRDAWGMNGIIIEDDKSIEQAYSELPAFKQVYDDRIKKNKEEFLKFVEVTQNRQVDYIELIQPFHPGMFGISPESMKIFERRNRNV
jgi:hypothetical protein